MALRYVSINNVLCAVTNNNMLYVVPNMLYVVTIHLIMVQFPTLLEHSVHHEAQEAHYLCCPYLVYDGTQAFQLVQ